jgi:DNA polymerase IIIc chi subunit
MNMKKLEKVYFYNSSQRDIIADISWLTEKLYKERNRIVVYCKDQETVELINTFLWSYKEDVFIPHSVEKNEQSIIDPVLITTEVDQNHNYNVLLAINGVLINEKDWLNFSTVYYFFDNKENKEKENARLMWKSFSALDITCKYWVNKENKWVLARSS